MGDVEVISIRTILTWGTELHSPRQLLHKCVVRHRYLQAATKRDKILRQMCRCTQIHQTGGECISDAPAEAEYVYLGIRISTE
jgi:hypothetical protein